jgi:hypothetical protein
MAEAQYSKIRFENDIDVYGYYDGKNFYRFDHPKCKKINCLYGKDTGKVYAIDVVHKANQLLRFN